jgi:hypothetical protein
VARWGTRLALAGAAGVVAAILSAIAVWFLGYSLLLLLISAGVGPSAAALIVAVVGLVLAALAGLGARWLLRPRLAPPTTAASGHGAVDELAGQIGSLAARQTVASVRAHPYGAIGAALAAGLAVGALPELRKLLSGFLKR